MNSRFKRKKLKSQILSVAMTLCMALQSLSATTVYAAEMEPGTAAQEAEADMALSTGGIEETMPGNESPETKSWENPDENGEESVSMSGLSATEMDEGLTEIGTEESVSMSGLSATEMDEGLTEIGTEESVSISGLSEEKTEEESTAMNETAVVESEAGLEETGAEAETQILLFPDNPAACFAAGDEGAVYSAEAETYRPGRYAWRRTSMEQEEAVAVFINSLLSRVGKGYTLNSPDNVNYYACNTLISEAFEDLGIDIRKILGGTGWANTADWKAMLDTHQVGDEITFSGTNEITFEIIAKDTTILGNPDAFQEPGTIILWIEPGKTTGHLGVSLGYFERVTDGMDPAWNGAAIQEKTLDSIREFLIASYGADRNLMYGNNQIYGLANVQFSSEYIGTDVGILGDAYGNILQYSGPYNGIFKVDALNTTYGVSVNNFVNGKEGSTVAYVLQPTEPKTAEGYAYFTKYGEALGTPIKGAAFTVYDSREHAEAHDGVTGVVGTITTDADGKAAAWLSTNHDYYAVESVTPEGLKPEPDKIWHIWLDPYVEAPTMNIGVPNSEIQSGTVKVIKKDAVTGQELSGAEFTLYEWSAAAGNYTEVAKLTDQEDGTYTLFGYTPRATGAYYETDKLIYTQDNSGKFKVAETGLPAGHTGTWEREFVLDEDGKTFVYTAENTPWYGTVSLTKLDADTREELKGATFILQEWSSTENNYETVGTFTDHGDGTYDLNQYTIRSSQTEVTDGKIWYTPDNQGRFRIAESKAPENYIGGWSTTFVLTEDRQVFYYDVENVLGSEELMILKKDDRGTVLADAAFGVYTTREEAEAASNENRGNPAAILVTGADGTASAKLSIGSYYVKELIAPENYKLDETVYGPFSVSSNPEQNGIHEIVNYPDNGTVELTKTGLNTDGLLHGLEGAVFAAYTTKEAAEAGTIGNTDTAAYVWTTDSNGKAKGTVEPGSYWIKEIQAPEGYELDVTVYGGVSGYAVSAVDGSVTVPVKENTPLTGKVRIRKVGANDQGQEVPLAGAVFAVYDRKDAAEAGNEENTETAAAVIVTGADGTAVTGELKAGHYWVKEIAAPDHYQLDETVYGGSNGFVVGWTTPVRNVSVDPNVPAGGMVEVSKQGAYPDGTVSGLAGAMFAVYSSRDAAEAGNAENTETAAAVITTDRDGKAKTAELEAGYYWVKEIAAPAGYVLDETVYGGPDGFKTGWDVPVRAVAANDNVPMTGKLSLEKDGYTFNGEAAALADAEFAVYASKADAEAAEHAVTVLKTGADGTSETQELAAGYYWIRETKAPEGYYLDDTVYGGDDGFVVGWTFDQVAVSVNTNLPKEGKLTLTKEGKNESGELGVLAGAVFGIYKSREDAENGTLENTANVYRMLTDSDGTAVSELLACDEYYVKELQAPDGYELNETVYGPLEVGIRNDLVEVPVEENIPKMGILRLEKVDSLTGNLLDGAVYTVYTDANGRKEAGTIAVMDGTGSIELPYDVYWVKETAVPYGYQLDETVYGPYTVGGPEGDVDVPPIREEEQRIEIRLEKRDAETGEAPQGDATLAGAVFELRAAEAIVHPDGATGVVYEAGELVATLVTDEKGHASVSTDEDGNWLHCGQYELVEVKAPAGYVLDPTPHAVDASYDRTQVTADLVSHDAGIVWNQIIRQPVVLHKFADEKQAPANELPGVGFTFYLLSDVCRANGVDSYYDLPMNEKGVDVTKLELDGLAVRIGGNGETELFSDMNGKVRTVPLVYGEYLVVETTPNPYYHASAPFTVTVPTVQTTDENGNEVEIHTIDYQPTLPFEVSVINWAARAYLQIEKIDAETGKPVRNAAAQFQILNAQGKPVVQHYWDGKEEVETDRFTTNAEGILRTWQTLKAGEYTLVEVNAPVGYIKGDPMPFSIKASGVTFELEGETYPAKISYTADGEPVAALAVKNTAITLEISKSDITTGEEIAGAVLSIYKQKEDGTKGDIATYQSEEGIETEAIWTTNGTKTVIKCLPAGNYILEEVSAPTGQGYVKAEAVPFTIEETGDIQRVEMKDDHTKIHISKTDIATGADVPGAKLQILNASGDVFDEWTTDGSEHVIEYMPVGEYTLVEIQAPTEDGYVHAEDVKFEVKETGEIQTVEMKDDHTKVHISKTDITTGADVPGAKLQILDASGEVFDEWITDGSEHVIEYMPVGEYTLVEIQAPTKDGYVHAEDVKFEVKETGEIQTVEMKDDHTKVVISKKDITNGEELPGATLQIINETGNIVEEWVSEEEPHLVEYLPVGSYILREITAPEGYASAVDVSFTVTETGGIQPVEMVDDITKVSIRKTDIVTGEDIIGATLTLTDSMGTVIDEWVTDGTEHYIEKLPVGTYTLRETIAPSGYVLASDISFSVTSTLEIQKVVMTDDYTKVEISKKDIVTGTEIAGATLTITDSEGKQIAQWITDGTVHRIDRLAAGTYTLTETTAPYEQGYTTAESVEFTVAATGEIKKVVMEDSKTTTEIRKTDILTGENLAGAVLILTEKESGREIERWVSNEEAHTITGLVPGRTYILSEAAAPDGYEIAAPVEFTVEDTDKVQIVVMKDVPTQGKIVSTTEEETEEDTSEAEEREEVILGIEDDSWLHGILLLGIGTTILLLAVYLAVERKSGE